MQILFLKFFLYPQRFTMTTANTTLDTGPFPRSSVRAVAATQDASGNDLQTVPIVLEELKRTEQSVLRSHIIGQSKMPRELFNHDKLQI